MQFTPAVILERWAEPNVNKRKEYDMTLSEESGIG